MIFTEAIYILSTTSKLTVRRDIVDLPLAFLLCPQSLHPPALPEETRDTTHSKADIGLSRAATGSRCTLQKKSKVPQRQMCANVTMVFNLPDRLSLPVRGLHSMFKRNMIIANRWTPSSTFYQAPLTPQLPRTESITDIWVQKLGLYT